MPFDTSKVTAEQFLHAQRAADRATQFTQDLVKIEEEYGGETHAIWARVLQDYVAAIGSFITSSLVEEPDVARVIAQETANELVSGVNKFFETVGSRKEAEDIVRGIERRTLGTSVEV